MPAVVTLVAAAHRHRHLFPASPSDATWPANRRGAQNPIRLVPKATSSKTTSHVPVPVSPICSWPTEVAVTVLVELESTDIGTPSSPRLPEW